jgi:hypothetical protein
VVVTAVVGSVVGAVAVVPAGVVEGETVPVDAVVGLAVVVVPAGAVVFAGPNRMLTQPESIGSKIRTSITLARIQNGRFLAIMRIPPLVLIFD